MEEKKGFKKLGITLVIASILLGLVILISFIIFFSQQKKVKTTTVNTGIVSMTYKSSSNSMQITNLQPISDISGKDSREEGSYFDFTVTSTIKGDARIQYEVSLVKDKTSTIPSDYVKVYLEQQNSGTYSKVFEPKVFQGVKKKTVVGSPAGSMVLTKETLIEDQVDNYRLRIWIAEDAPPLDPAATFAVRINVHGKAK